MPQDEPDGLAQQPTAQYDDVLEDNFNIRLRKCVEDNFNIH